MKINSKDQRLAFAKSVDAEKRQVQALVSTYEWDRTFERFAKGAWRLDNFKKNPVVMWGHDYRRPPVGKAIQINETDAGLMATVQFAEDAFSEDIWQLVKGGFLSAFSVGFNPTDFHVEQIDGTKKGVVYTDAELLEFSVVSIPANPGAVIGRDMAMLAQKALGKNSVVMVKNGDKEEFIASPGPEETPETPPETPAETPPENAPEAPQTPNPEETNPDTPTEEQPSETPPESSEQPSPAPSDLAAQLKYIVQLAKSHRHEKLVNGELNLLNNAIATFQEIINEKEGGVSVEVVDQLHKVLDGLAEAVKDLYPDATQTVQKVMHQIDRALSRGKAA